jgi:hypothetical protein
MVGEIAGIIYIHSVRKRQKRQLKNREIWTDLHKATIAPSTVNAVKTCSTVKTSSS